MPQAELCNMSIEVVEEGTKESSHCSHTNEEGKLIHSILCQRKGTKSQQPFFVLIYNLSSSSWKYLKELPDSERWPQVTPFVIPDRRKSRVKVATIPAKNVRQVNS